MKAIFFFTKLKETEKNKKQLISRMDRIGIKGNHKLEWNGMEFHFFFIGISSSSSSSSSTSYVLSSK